jgi:hypothetical protein
MNDAIRSHIGGKKSSSRESLGGSEEEAAAAAGPGRKMPKEAIQFAKSMGIDMNGIEAEAEDMWRMLTDMQEKSPLEYQSFVKQQFDDAKEAEAEEKEMKEMEEKLGPKVAAAAKKKKEDARGEKGKFFRPEAGFAFRVQTDGNDGVKVRVAGSAGRELLINVCHHKAVSPPLDKNGQEVLDDRMSADGLQIPLIVGPVRELTLIDQPLGVDVVVHPSVTHRCNLYRVFLAQVVDLVLDWVKQETDVQVYRPKSGSYWKMCTNVYMGGRGDNGEVPVLFPMEHALDQGVPKEERSSGNTRPTQVTQQKKPDAMSAPSALLNMMRQESDAMDMQESQGTDDILSLNTSSAPAKKSLIQDLSAPAPAPKPAAKRKPKTKPKPSVKKGFLNDPKTAGTLYPEGSEQGVGGATGGTYAKFMSKCQVVDTSTMNDEDRDAAMQSYADTGEVAGPAPAPAPAPKPSVQKGFLNIPKPSPSASAAKAPVPPAANDRLVSEMERLMGQVDDQWDTTTSMGGDTDDGMSQGEWDNVFKDLAKSLGKDGAGTAPGMLNAVAPDMAMPSPTPTLPAAAQKTQQQAVKATVQPTVVPAKAVVPTAPRTKAFKMTHTLGPDIAVAVDETVVGGRHGVSLNLTNIPAEMIAKADVQVSKDSLKVAFSPTASVTVTCKHIIEGDSIVAKTSKKKKTLNVSAFMLKI